jgi:Glycosyl transferase 4-like domain
MSSTGSSNLLMIAFHYPPYGWSSGLRRTHSFSRFLPGLGWQPTVLTAHPRVYDTVQVDSANQAIEGEEAVVIRAFSLDALRHFGFRGKYPAFLALPDRWISWLPSAVMKGLSIISKQEIKVIWSTYPIATAQLIGLCLWRLSGLPWVADFRDPMIDSVHPAGRVKRKIFRWIERKTLTHASGVCFTTPSALEHYRNHYPYLDSSHWTCIQNGYDERDFDSITLPSKKPHAIGQVPPPPLTLLHSGTLYPLERDPSCFFSALAKLKSNGEISKNNLRVVLRATGHDEFVKSALELHQIEDIVSLKQGIEYSQALREMSDVGGLLLFQASNCNHQIPAKLYEYMRAGRPLLALTDPSGDTANLVERENAGIVADLHHEEATLQGLRDLILVIKSGDFRPVSPERLHRYSREKQAAQLAEFLTEIVNRK